MGEMDDEGDQEVLSYSAFLNRQLLQAWRERLREHETSANKNRIVGHSLRMSRLWTRTAPHERDT